MKHHITPTTYQTIQRIVLGITIYMACTQTHIVQSRLLSLSCTGPCQTTTFAAPDGEIPISLPEPGISNQPGDPCPSIIKVSGIPACHVISNITVKLEGVAFADAHLLTVVLLAPFGRCAVLINGVAQPDNGFIDTFFDTDLAFNDCFGRCLPRTATEIDIPDGNYKPADYDKGNYCFNVSGCTVATSQCHASTSLFNGKSPLGCWKLFTCVKPGTDSTEGEILSWKLIIDHCLPCTPHCANGDFNHDEASSQCSIKPTISASCCPINCAAGCCKPVCLPCNISMSSAGNCCPCRSKEHQSEELEEIKEDNKKDSHKESKQDYSDTSKKSD